MFRRHFIHHNKCTSVGFSILCFVLQLILATQSFSADSLSYSGRLVQTNGAPVAGPVDLKVELSYTNAPTTILCSQDLTNIVLSNGVFHLKLDFNCGANGTLADVLNLVPANESAAIRVTDMTHSKVYSFQAVHSMPFASVSGTAKQLVQMGATNNQVLKWNDTTKKWEPGSIAGAGTVTSVSGTLPISVATGSTAPVISITQANATTDGYLSSADWNAFNSKQGPIAAGTTAQYYRGDKSWQTLDTSAVSENVANLYFTNARALGVPLAGFVTGTGAIVATDTALQAFGKAQGQINSLTTASSNYLIKNSTDSITGVVNVGTIGLLQLAYTPVGMNDAANKSYVDAGDNLKVNKAGDSMSGVLTLDSDLKIKGGVNYVTLKGHASSSAYNLVLPSSTGTSGYVLSTDGSGNTSWINPGAVSAGTGTVTSASIVDGTIVDVDISATAAIAQSKIANLTTDLGNKVSTTLANGKILVGSAGNVATAVAVSGDATLSNTGTLTLANSGVTANTYNSVTVDAKGRVTGGTNPTTLAGYGITDVLVTGVSVTAPITNTGTASVPLIGMPAATTSADGYLTATNWNTFNNKQAAITAASTLNTGSITSNLQGGVVLAPYGTAAGNTGEIRLKELAANGANFVALRSPDALAADILFTLPSGVGTAGQVLTTDGLNPATLSWTSVATTGTSLVGDIGGTIGANTIGAGKVTLTHLSATGTKNSTTYLRGDNTWSVLQTDVQALLLSAYTLGTNAVVTTGDSIVSAFGKLQKQISDLTTSAVGGDLTGSLPNPTIAKLQGSPLTITASATKNVLRYNGTNWVNSMLAASDLSATGTTDATTYLAGDNTWKNFNTNVIAAPLTGLSSAGITKANGTLLASDSITTAFNKLLFTQGDYVSKTADQTINGTLAINSVTGFITVPTPVNPNDAANKGYVDGFGQWTKSGSDIYRSSGNVGIGTTSPVAPLDVSGGIRSSGIDGTWGLELKSTTANTTNSAYIVYRDNQATPQKIYQRKEGTQLITYGNDSSYRFAIGTDATTPSYFNGGNVGIGTTAPSDLLTINNGNLGLRTDGGVGNNTRAKIIPLYDAGGSNYGGALAFQTTSNLNVSTEAMRITKEGNVGIGTTAPSAPLEVVGNVKISGQIVNDAWTNVASFTNSWTAYYPVAGVAAPGYRKGKDGRVALRGCLAPGTWSTAAFTLPAGHIPPTPMTVPMTGYLSGTGAVAAYAWIYTDGTFRPWLGNSATWICMDGISFPTD